MRCLVPLAATLASCGSARVIALGDGLCRYPEDLAESLADRAHLWSDGPSTPTAAAVARLALAEAREDIAVYGAPTYIRLSEAEIKYPDGNPGGAFRARVLDSRSQ